MLISGEPGWRKLHRNPLNYGCDVSVTLKLLHYYDFLIFSRLQPQSGLELTTLRSRVTRSTDGVSLVPHKWRFNLLEERILESKYTFSNPPFSSDSLLGLRLEVTTDKEHQCSLSLDMQGPWRSPIESSQGHHICLFLKCFHYKEYTLIF